MRVRGASGAGAVAAAVAIPDMPETPISVAAKPAEAPPGAPMAEPPVPTEIGEICDDPAPPAGKSAEPPLVDDEPIAAASVLLAASSGFRRPSSTATIQPSTPSPSPTARSGELPPPITGATTSDRARIFVSPPGAPGSETVDVDGPAATSSAPSRSVAPP